MIRALFFCTVSATLTLGVSVPTRTPGVAPDRVAGRDSAHARAQPWEHAIPAQKTPNGLSTIRASECGKCHVAVYEEWRSTAHALALRDPQFQAEWKKDEHLWLCLNCHTPLENQQERLVTGLVGGDFRRPVTRPNDRFDVNLRHEGITCAVCHVRDGSVVGPGFGGNAPHPVTSGRDALSSSACERCHNVQGRLSNVLVCSFTTGDEWRASGVSENGTGCVDCHMPPVSRPLVEGGPVRRARRHTWMGAGIAKLPELSDSTQVNYVAGYDVEVRARRASAKDGAVEVVVDAAITNARAGHDVPTGDVERFITLELTLRDGDNAPLWRRVERIGETWQWYPEAKQISDNTLKPGERREFRYLVPVPDDAHDPLSLEIVVRNHRMTLENARAMGVDNGYPIEVEAVRRTVPVTGPW